MLVTKKNLYVKELIKDLKVDGLVQKYDDNSDFMFVKIIEVGKEIENKVEYQDKENTVLVLKRIAKIPFISGYFINEEDILAILTKEEFEAL